MYKSQELVTGERAPVFISPDKIITLKIKTKFHCMQQQEKVFLVRSFDAISQCIRLPWSDSIA
ncbi:MAG: hypothetical protein EBU46_03625 [Nitrosomonadaceae bacterium]|nr:hypothetical protein [Nitrosomonadaceae bacterium]